MHWFTVYPDAWLSGTADLTTEESGAFWNLCCHYMAKDGRVPDDDVLLARICKVSTRRWKRIKQRLLADTKIEARGGFIWQEKCEERLKCDGNFAKSQRIKAEKRWASGTPKPLNNGHSLNAGGNAGGNASTEYSSLSKDKGAQAPSVERLKILFDAGVSVLVSAGSTEKLARQLVGRWRSRLRDDAKLLALITTAQRQAALDPISYITKAITNDVNGGRPLSAAERSAFLKERGLQAAGRAAIMAAVRAAGLESCWRWEGE